MGDKAPLTRTLRATVPAAEANAAQDTLIGAAPFAGVITAAKVFSEAAVTAHGTNYRTLRVVNFSTNASGIAIPAELPLDTPTTDNLAAYTVKELPLSETAFDVTVAANDVLVFDETVAAGGLAHSGLVVEVTISRE